VNIFHFCHHTVNLVVVLMDSNRDFDTPHWKSLNNFRCLRKQSSHFHFELLHTYSRCDRFWSSSLTYSESPFWGKCDLVSLSFLFVWQIFQCDKVALLQCDDQVPVVIMQFMNSETESSVNSITSAFRPLNGAIKKFNGTLLRCTFHFKIGGR
jgi:hypothetical protein